MTNHSQPAGAPVQVIVCPRCRGPLTVTDTHVSCPPCAWRRASDRGFLPLCDADTSALRGLGPRLMHWRPLARVYERVWRPVFVSIASSQRPDLDAEQAWIEVHLAAAAGGAARCALHALPSARRALHQLATAYRAG